jgi:hypothetical protein
MKPPPPSNPGAPVLRPPDFFLPSGAKSATRGGGREVYLSWGGAIYGPAGPEEVLAGVRTSWFEPDALFWLEGQDTWLPVADFPALVNDGRGTVTAHPAGPIPEQAPPLPAAGTTAAVGTTASPDATDSRQRRRGRGRDHGRKRNRKPRSPRRTGRTSKTGRLIVLALVILAAAVTVGLIFLLMRL